MNLLESLRISWRAIKGHKLRSTLTTLGIIIGIAAVIALMTLGGAFEEDIRADIDEDEAIVSVQTQVETDFGLQFPQAEIYTQTDVEAIEALEGVEYVAPDGSLPAVQVTHEDEQRIDPSVDATTPEQFADDMWVIEEGEVFSSEDEAVVNEIFVEWFDDAVSVDDEITIRFDDREDLTFTVVGIVDDDLDGFTPPTVSVPLAHY